LVNYGAVIGLEKSSL